MISRVNVKIIRFFLIFLSLQVGGVSIFIVNYMYLTSVFSIYFQSTPFCVMLFALSFKEYSLLITSSCIFHLTAVRYVFRILRHVRSKTTHYMFAYQLKVFILHSFIFMRKKSSTLVFFLQHDASCDVMHTRSSSKWNYCFRNIRNYERYQPKTNSEICSVKTHRVLHALFTQLFRRT